MLFGEWKLEDALVVEREEGCKKRETEIAKNALGEGASVEFIQKSPALRPKPSKASQTGNFHPAWKIPPLFYYSPFPSSGVRRQNWCLIPFFNRKEVE
jgi:hypothetical protein